MEDNEDDIGRKLIEKGNLGAKVGAKQGVCNRYPLYQHMSYRSMKSRMMNF